MEGDFCPLVEMVHVIENLIPAGHAHIVVDEAHTSAICGPNGSGYIPLLRLNDRIHTVVHAFGKGWGFRGGNCALFISLHGLQHILMSIVHRCRLELS
jgi:8-amino-7-oxononanoate synthase